MHQRLKKFLRRFPQQISLTTLMILVACCAVTSYYLAPWFNTPREYPILHIGKVHDEQSGDPASDYLVITVRYQRARTGGEYYADYPPWGTVNHSIGSFGDRESSYYHEEWIGTDKERETQKVPAIDQARFDSLLKYVQQRVNVIEQPWGWKQNFLLPADYPTFAEFESNYQMQKRLANAATIIPRGEVSSIPTPQCESGSK